MTSRTAFDRIARFRSKIEGSTLEAFVQPFGRRDMRCPEIGNMNIILHGGFVLDRKIGGEHGEIIDVTLQRHHRSGMRRASESRSSPIWPSGSACPH